MGEKLMAISALCVGGTVLLKDEEFA